MNKTVEKVLQVISYVISILLGAAVTMSHNGDCPCCENFIKIYRKKLAKCLVVSEIFCNFVA